MNTTADEKDLLQKLRMQFQNAKGNSPYWSKKLAKSDVNEITALEDIGRLPVLRKSELVELQSDRYLGALSTTNSGRPKHIFFSPGPIVEPEPISEKDAWRMSAALLSADFRPEDIVANCFSYHLTPAGIMFDQALQVVGSTVFPAGVQRAETLIDAFHYLSVSAYVGTPDFLKIILEKADDLGRPIGTVSKAVVSGGALFPELKEWYGQRGIRVKQCYGTAELGLIAYETDDDEGMRVADDCIVEIVRPGSNDVVEDGEVGEVVVTTFDPHYPLIRFGTGDLSAFVTAAPSLGKAGKRLKGWLGRADQTTKIKGMFVHPGQIEKVVRQIPGAVRARAEVRLVDGRDQMLFLCEREDQSEYFVTDIKEIIKSECRVNGDVRIVPPK
ncbi:MAG: AMP-binding protein, partial [Sneathiella sp.]